MIQTFIDVCRCLPIGAAVSIQQHLHRLSAGRRQYRRSTNAGSSKQGSPCQKDSAADLARISGSSNHSLLHQSNRSPPGFLQGELPHRESPDTGPPINIVESLTRPQEHVFPFFPIEPPRPVPNRLESYARRQHQFAPVVQPSTPTKSSIKPPSIFRKGSQAAVGSNSSPSSTTAPLQVCSICIDARLPDPAIITCNEPLPLRIIITKLNESPATIYLQLLQIELVANTVVRAHHLSRENLTSTVLISKSNMRIRLSEIDKVMEIDKGWWKDTPLPNTVAPSFDTCNISRTYFVIVKVGLTHGLGDQTFVRLYTISCILPIMISRTSTDPSTVARTHRPRPQDACLRLQRHTSPTGVTRSHGR